MNKVSGRASAFVAAFLIMQALPAAPAAATAPFAAAAPLAHNLAPAAMRAALMARAQALGAAWRQSHPGQEDTIAPPSITSGNILTPSIDVTMAPAAPKVKFNFTSPGGLEEADFIFQSPAGQSFSYTDYYLSYYAPGLTSGSLKVETPNSFDLYSQPGTWTLAYIYLYDFMGNFVELTGDQITSIFATTTLQVTNPNSADFTPPTISSGTILTPKISAKAANPVFSASVKANDDISGFQFIGITLLSPSQVYANGSGSLPSPETAATVTTYVPVIAYGATAPEIGTWTIIEINLCDVANNCAYISDPASITTIFGKNTFKVTK